MLVDGKCLAYNRGVCRLPDSALRAANGLPCIAHIHVAARQAGAISARMLKKIGTKHVCVRKEMHPIWKTELCVVRPHAVRDAQVQPSHIGIARSGILCHSRGAGRDVGHVCSYKILYNRHSQGLDYTLWFEPTNAHLKRPRAIRADFDYSKVTLPKVPEAGCAFLKLSIVVIVSWNIQL